MTSADSGSEPGEITALLHDAASGGTDLLRQVLPLVYDELLSIARQRLRHEAPGHTLDTGALVHEAYLRFSGQKNAHFRNRQHFYAVASEAMRRVLVDHARRLHAGKRGSGAPLVELNDADQGTPDHPFLSDDRATELLALDDALHRLAEFNPQGAAVVQQRFFAGLSTPEVADVMGISERTVRRSWMVARAWLRRELDPGTPGALTLLSAEPPSAP